MDSAFAWIGHIIEWWGAFIPRLVIIRSTHAGVKFTRGAHPVVLKPGLHFYWPIVTQLDVFPVARQTHNLPSQSLLTKDSQQVVVSGIVVYSISDPLAAAANNFDVSDTINDITLVAIAEVITGNDLAEILCDITDGIKRELTIATRKALRQYGVRVHLTALTDFSTATVIKHLGINNSHNWASFHNSE